MNTGLQQNNFAPMGTGQQNHRRLRRNFMQDTGLMPQVTEPVAPGIPDPIQPITGGQHGGQINRPPASNSVNTNIARNNPNMGMNPPNTATGVPSQNWQSYVQSLLPQGASSPDALAAIEPQLNAQGIRLQRNSAGQVRGRIYLPNPGGYEWGNGIDLVGNGGWGQPWQWTERHQDGPVLPKRAPAHELYNFYSSQLQPMMDMSNSDDALLIALLNQNEELI